MTTDASPEILKVDTLVIQDDLKPEIKFHPDFSVPVQDAAIIQANDGTAFCFDLTLLGKLSTFFADLISLNDHVSLENHDTHRIIMLPSATKSALHFSLKLIQSLTTSNATIPQLPNNLTSIGEIFRMADAYDLPIVTSTITHMAFIYFASEPFKIYAIAAASKIDHLAIAASKLTIQHDLDTETRYSSFREFMMAHAPMYYIKLRELHLTREKKWEALKKDLMNRNMYDRGNYFTKRCRSCPSNEEFEGDFDKFRREVVRTVYEAVENSNPRLLIDDLCSHITSAFVKCSNCTIRLVSTFESAIAEYKTGLKDSI